MNRIQKSVLGLTCLAALAVGQQSNLHQQSGDPAYQQPTVTEPAVVPPTPVYQPVYEPAREPVDDMPETPQEPFQQPTPPDQPNQPDPPAEIAPMPVLEPLPDIGPSIKDWEPTPPGELNPRTGIVEPNWNNIGTGIPDYSKPYDPDEDEELKAKKAEQKEKCKKHRHLSRHWDMDWEYCPHHSSDW